MHILFIFILGERCVYTYKQLDAICSDSRARNHISVIKKHQCQWWSSFICILVEAITYE